MVVLFILEWKLKIMAMRVHSVDWVMSLVEIMDVVFTAILTNPRTFYLYLTLACQKKFHFNLEVSYFSFINVIKAIEGLRVRLCKLTLRL